MARKKVTAQELALQFTSDGKNLVGHLHKVDSNKLLIMCHGFTGSKIENKRLFVEAARTISSEGLSVLRFDFYGSGDSDGEFHETRVSTNIRNLVDACAWASDNGYSEIAVLGISMGAATAVLAMERIPAKALVLWSTVPDFKKLFQSFDQNADQILETKKVIEYDGWAIDREFFLDALSHNIKAALAQIDCPKLIVQGTADAPVFVQGFSEFQDIVLPPADFMEIPGAGHTYQTPHHRHQVIRQTAIWLSRHF